MTRGPAPSFLVRRMGSSRLLVASVLLTAFITASFLAALASFGAQSLPRATHRQLARSPGMSIVIIGLVDGATARADTQSIRATMGRAFGSVPYQLAQAQWSDPLGFPGGTAPPGLAQAEVSAPSRIRDYAVLESGGWPGPPAGGQPVPVAVPGVLAHRLHAAPGTVLVLRDRNSGAPVRLRVSGLYRQRDPTSAYWGIDQVWTCGAHPGQCSASHGPMVVNAAAFGPGGFAVDQASWVVLPDPARIAAGDLRGLAARVSHARAVLQRPGRLGGLLVTTGVPAALMGASRALAAARSLLTISALELLLVAGVTLTLAARLLASHRDGESALLRARGAARWQLARPALAEAVLLGGAAAVAGAFAGSRLAVLLASTGPLRGAGLRLSGLPPQVWWAMLTVIIVCAVVLVAPVLSSPAPGPGHARRGRPAALAGAVAAGGDVALLVLALLAGWELHSRSAAGHPGTAGVVIDPVLVAAPALALAGISLLPARALPLAARALDRLASWGRHLGGALAGWEISRRPLRQSGPAILLVLAVATGTLALAQYQSWHLSALDQAAFTTGADVRLATPTPVPPGKVGTITAAPGVTAAMPVTTITSAAGGEILALGARAAPSCVLARRDLAGLPSAAPWQRITPAGAAPGVRLPGRPARLRIIASLSGRGLGHVSATVTVQDATGAVYQLPAGTLPADGGRHALTAAISATRQAGYPVRLLGLSLAYPLPEPAPPRTAGAGGARAAVLTVAGLAVAPSAAGAVAAPFTGGHILAAWHPTASAPTLTGPQAPPGAGGTALGAQPAVLGWRAAGAQSQELTFQSGRAPRNPAHATLAPPEAVLTVMAPAPARAIPAIATGAFLRGRHIGVGAVLRADVGSGTVPVKVVARVPDFPTVTAAGGALIVDQAAVQDTLAAQRGTPLPVTGWWLRTAGGGVPRGLPPGATVTSRARAVGALLGNPLLATPPQAALALAGAAALLAAMGLLVSVAASLRARRRQNMLLAAFGVSRYARAGQLCLAELMLSVPTAAAGLLAGVGMAHLLIPAVTLTPSGTAPLPPVLVEVPPGAAWLALAAAAVPVLAAAATFARRPDPAAELRAADLS